MLKCSVCWLWGNQMSCSLAVVGLAISLTMVHSILPLLLFIPIRSTLIVECSVEHWRLNSTFFAATRNAILLYLFQSSRDPNSLSRWRTCMSCNLQYCLMMTIVLSQQWGNDWYMCYCFTEHLPSVHMGDHNLSVVFEGFVYLIYVLNLAFSWGPVTLWHDSHSQNFLQQ